MTAGHTAGTAAHKKQQALEKAKAVKATESTLRDQFAMAALTSLCHATAGSDGQAGDVAERAYLVADAMLAAREPKEDPDEAQPVLEKKG